MQTYQIIIGFSEIKAEFRIKTGTAKTMEELRLWFNLEDDVLYVHDYAEHERSMALAIYNEHKKTWWVTLKDGTYGKMLIEWVIQETDLSNISKQLNTEYISYGFTPFNRR